jgi:putative membrane protein
MKHLFAIGIQILVVLFAFPFINKDFKVHSDWKDALFIVILFGALNFVIRKLIIIFTLGLGVLVYYLSLGIAGLILNALILVLIGSLLPNMLKVPNFSSAFIGGVLLTLVNFFVGTDNNNDD